MMDIRRNIDLIESAHTGKLPETTGTTYRYVTNCTDDCHGPGGEAIHEMVAQASDLSYRDLVKLVGKGQLAQVFPNYDWRTKPRDLTLAKDWAVSYHRSVWRGIPCVYVRHSGIEHIFTPNGQQPDEWEYVPPKDEDED